MEPPHISPKKIDAWIALVRAQQGLLKSIETALKNAGLPQLSWYDVLLELSRPGVDGLRPMELEKRLLLPQYGMSRLLDRLEKAGLIARIKAPEDGRGQIIRITDTGRDMQAKMWPVYATALNVAFAQKLSVKEADQLRAVLCKLEATGERR